MKHDVLVRRAIVLGCAVALGALSDAASAQQATMKIATAPSGDRLPWLTLVLPRLFSV